MLKVFDEKLISVSLIRLLDDLKDNFAKLKEELKTNYSILWNEQFSSLFRLIEEETKINFDISAKEQIHLYSNVSTKEQISFYSSTKEQINNSQHFFLLFWNFSLFNPDEAYLFINQQKDLNLFLCELIKCPLVLVCRVMLCLIYLCKLEIERFENYVHKLIYLIVEYRNTNKTEIECMNQLFNILVNSL